MTGPVTGAAATGRWRRRLPALAVAALALVVGILVHLAGTTPVTLRGVDPADGAALTAPPRTVSLAFDGPVTAREVHVTVTAARGGPVLAGPPAVSGDTVTVDVSIAAAGEYLTGYHLVLDDGRTVSGVSRFRVTGTGGPAAPPDPAVVPAAPSAAPVAGAGGHRHGDDPVSVLLSLLAVAGIGTLLTVLARPPRLRD